MEGSTTCLKQSEHFGGSCEAEDKSSWSKVNCGTAQNANLYLQPNQLGKIMPNTVTNAFDWKAYTDEEHAKRGDPFKAIKRNAEISANVTQGVHKIRKKKPSHGTIFGISEKRISVRAPEMMYAKTKN
jgi:hypothetical protein